LKLSSVRMGRWKEAVSIAQRARKKRYCSRMGCDASAFEGLSVLLFGAPAWVVVALVRPEVKGGGGVNGSAGDEGVAFSIRAHVR
jgi:hypothetical protein